MRVRNQNLHIRLTDQEMHDLREKAEKTGVNVQTFVIASIYGLPLCEKPTEEYLKVTKAIRDSCTKLIRIAFIGKNGGTIDHNDLWNIIFKLQDAAKVYTEGAD